MELKCNFCNYKTVKKYNLIRHQIAKHNYDTENVNLEENICKKCNKMYKTKIYLIEHEKKCIGIDDLTCSRCMKTFSNRQNKYRHIKKNNCEPRSIIHARCSSKKSFDVEKNTEKQTINNNITQNITNNNYYVINNYGNERLDYLSYDKMLSMFKKFYTCPSLLTKEIHFNDQFPENNNILYQNKTFAKIKVDDELVIKDLNLLAEELVKEKASKVHKFGEENKKEICTNMELDKYKEILDLLFTYAILQQPKDKYKLEINKVKDMILNEPTKLRKYVKSIDYS
jgi:hypothetical protein|tara:strand:+ start:1481 stop:2332 length:852 start_codon:yes stop_codon:yes gene_type:complete